MKRGVVREAGDTIVEVLIAIAVVSSVLGIAYGSMNRNIQTTRDNQERTEAVRLGEGQIEGLKNAASFNQAGIDAQTGSFCIINSTPTTAGCTLGIYTMAIVNDAAADIYRVTISWTSLRGNANEVIMVYRG